VLERAIAEVERRVALSETADMSAS
jgi:hypothetical protein